MGDDILQAASVEDDCDALNVFALRVQNFPADAQPVAFRTEGIAHIGYAVVHQLERPRMGGG